LRKRGDPEIEARDGIKMESLIKIGASFAEPENIF
jgi:hypothetical protein